MTTSLFEQTILDLCLQKWLYSPPNKDASSRIYSIGQRSHIDVRGFLLQLAVSKCNVCNESCFWVRSTHYFKARSTVQVLSDFACLFGSSSENLCCCCCCYFVGCWHLSCPSGCSFDREIRVLSVTIAFTITALRHLWVNKRHAIASSARNHGYP